MQTYTQEQLDELYDNMPESLHDVMWDEKTTGVILDIERRYMLESKNGLLGKITGRVLMGALPIQKFRATIQEELQIPEEQAREIATEIRDTIFAPVAEDLRKVHGLDNAPPASF